MKKRWLLIPLVICVLVVLVWLFRSQLIDRAIGRQVLASINRLQTNLLEDGKLHVIVVGSGSPATDPFRVQACVAVIADGDFLMFDTGGASAYRLDNLGLPVQNLTTVFFTHLHSDHIADLPLVANLGWRHGRKNPLNVYGPIGTESVVQGFNQAHRPDLEFRHENTKGFTAPVEVAQPVGRDIPTPGETDSVAVYEGKSGIKVQAFLVDHRPVEPAFGYRIEYKGRIVVISGDTRLNDNVGRYSKNADILIHEAFNKKLVDRMISLAPADEHNTPFGRHLVEEAKGVQHYHTSPVDAAELAAKADVKTLVFTHIIPPLGLKVARLLVTEPFFLDGVKDRFSGEVMIAEDGTHLTLEPK